jgi:hypothetical protein
MWPLGLPAKIINIPLIVNDLCHNPSQLAPIREEEGIAMKKDLLELIDSCLHTAGRFAAAGFEPARQLQTQLRWCWLRVNGLAVDPPPAPLAMSWIVDEFFGKYGGDPVLASRLREIESAISAMRMDRAA